jgi:hypothetical protein
VCARQAGSSYEVRDFYLYHGPNRQQETNEGTNLPVGLDGSIYQWVDSPFAIDETQEQSEDTSDITCP